MGDEATKKLANLHQAARDGDNETLIRLIGDGFELDARDKLRRTPLHLAAWAGHTSTVKALVGAGCNIHAAAVDDMNALHFACQKDRKEVARALLNAGERPLNASVRAATAYGPISCCISTR
jgi:ankyrin repeat protein